MNAKCYVYKYIDRKDNIVKYVGCVYGKKATLAKRISQHENDYWFSYSSYIVKYLDINIQSRTDAEYIESHFINLYKSYKYYNKAKSGWGVSSFIPSYDDNQWKELYTKNCNSNMIDTSKELLLRLAMFNKIHIIEEEIDELESLIKKLQYLEERKNDLQKYIEENFSINEQHYKKEGRPKLYSNELLEFAMSLLDEFSYNEVCELTGISKSTMIRFVRNKSNDKIA